MKCCGQDSVVINQLVAVIFLWPYTQSSLYAEQLFHSGVIEVMTLSERRPSFNHEQNYTVRCRVVDADLENFF